ncbi:MAG: DUF4170 domain-containing protein [Salinarimonas sp.]
MTEIKQGVPTAAETTSTGDTQLLHLVFGGELDDPEHVRFRDLAGLDIVGIYPSYATAFAAWKAKAQATVDNAHMRYFIVHLHRLLEPPVG